MDEENKDVASFPHYRGIGPTAAMLIEELKEGTPGDTITDVALMGICGYDTSPKGKGYSALGTAIGVCLREHGILWSRIRSAGAIRCLDIERKVEYVKANNKHMGRVARKAVNILGSIAPSEIPDEKRPEFYSTLAQTGMIAEMSKPKTRKKLEDKKIMQPVDMKKLLAALD
jgi:hypothetical protein